MFSREQGLAGEWKRCWLVWKGGWDGGRNLFSEEPIVEREGTCKPRLGAILKITNGFRIANG